jgi:hypothetical protein
MLRGRGGCKPTALHSLRGLDRCARGRLVVSSNAKRGISGTERGQNRAARVGLLTKQDVAGRAHGDTMRSGSLGDGALAVGLRPAAGGRGVELRLEQCGTITDFLDFDDAAASPSKTAYRIADAAAADAATARASSAAAADASARRSSASAVSIEARAAGSSTAAQGKAAPPGRLASGWMRRLDGAEAVFGRSGGGAPGIGRSAADLSAADATS